MATRPRHRFCFCCLSPSVVEGRDPTPAGQQSMSATEAASQPHETVPGLINIIQNINTNIVDLDQLTKHISNLLELREKERFRNQNAPVPTKFAWPDVAGLKKIKEILSLGSTNVSNLITSGRFKRFIEEIGKGGLPMVSAATTGLLVVSYVLERYDDVSTNKERCWALLKQMSFVGSIVYKLEKSPRAAGEEKEDVIESATTLVVEGAIMCCSQMNSSPWREFLSASRNKEDLSRIEEKLNVIYREINVSIGLRILTTIEWKGKSPLSKRYPTDAVGIDESIKEVLNLMGCESEERAITVIIHGFGGMGKTTLADAVFSYVGGCRYSQVQLFEDIYSKPNIVKLQKRIFEDLMGSEAPVPDIRKFQDGQRELQIVLENVESAVIYIDNVLDGEALRKLLPPDMSKAKKVRLLLTARDGNVKITCPRPCTEPKIFKMAGIEYEEAILILRREIKDGINDTQFKEIIQICGKIPLMLTLVAPFIGRADDKQEAYATLMQQKEKWTCEDFKEMRYAFAYEALPRDCKEPFLDICTYFNGWKWDIVQDIVGINALKVLTDRSLVGKTTDGLTSVHDVILTLACQMSKEELNDKEVRKTFSQASEVKDFLEHGDTDGIKGIWLTDQEHVLTIQASTLEKMNVSLRVLHLGELIVEGNCNRTRIFQQLIFFKAKIKELPFTKSQLPELRHLSYATNTLDTSILPSTLSYLDIDGGNFRRISK